MGHLKSISPKHPATIPHNPTLPHNWGIKAAFCRLCTTEGAASPATTSETAVRRRGNRVASGPGAQLGPETDLSPTAGETPAGASEIDPKR